jgi:hypothetical protein
MNSGIATTVTEIALIELIEIASIFSFTFKDRHSPI